MSSYQYRKSHRGDKMVVRSSYLHSGISYTGKMVSLYWIGALVDMFLNCSNKKDHLLINESIKIDELFYVHTCFTREMIVFNEAYRQHSWVISISPGHGQNTSSSGLAPRKCQHITLSAVWKDKNKGKINSVLKIFLPSLILLFYALSYWYCHLHLAPRNFIMKAS